jgi:hypothetical protein
MKAVRYHAYGDSNVLAYEDAGLAELAAVHDQAAAGQLPGKTILIP